MLNLAIECSGTAGSVAVFQGENVLSYSKLDSNVTSVRTLASEIERQIRLCGRPTLISVTSGPGSFTGLRVGLTTAKMLSMAWNVPIAAVDTLQAIALRAQKHLSPSTYSLIIPVMNAFRGQVFSAAIQFDRLQLPTFVAESCVLDSAAWCANPLIALGVGNGQFPPNSEVWATGSGLTNFTPMNIEIALAEQWNPTAHEVAFLGQLCFEGGSTHDAFSLHPNYIRASAAEENSPRQET